MASDVEGAAEPGARDDGVSVTSSSRTTTPGRLNELAALVVGVWSQTRSICRVGGVGLAGELLPTGCQPEGLVGAVPFR